MFTHKLCKVWAALAILFAGCTAVLLHGVLDSSVSSTYCSDELERQMHRQRVIARLVRPLYPPQGESIIPQVGLFPTP
jgi:hypothetical protein